MDRLEELLGWPARQRMPNLLLIGPTNNGKSMIVEKFRRVDTAPVEGMGTGMDEMRLPIAHDAPAADARRACERALADWKVSGSSDDVLLVATELVQNVTKHTDDGGELHLALHDEVILIEVTDTNPQPPRVHDPDPCRLGGRGLLLVAATARRWGTRPVAWAGRTGKIVWAELGRRLSA